jgi:tetratricopeptide (TPR) repeat protein
LRLSLVPAAIVFCGIARGAMEPGFSAFYNNEYDQAIIHFEEQVKRTPTDPGAYNHLAQALLYRELYRNGALESQLVSGSNPFLRRDKMQIAPGRKQQLMRTLDKGENLAEIKTEKNSRDAMAWYDLGVAHGLRANYFFLVEKAWIDSLRQAAAARKAEEQALEIDPHLVDANLIPALYQYVVGSLPFFMRTLSFVGGIRADRDEGIRRLELVARQGNVSRYDAQVLLAVLYRRERRPAQAIPLLKSLAETFPRNNLFRFELVQMYSDCGDGKSAERILNEIERMRQAKAPGFGDVPEAKVQFVAGNLHFWYRDIPAALANFQAATKQADQLDLNSAVLAWMRLGQVYDLLNNYAAAIPAYQKAIRMAPNSDVADESKRYLSTPYRRKEK